MKRNTIKTYRNALAVYFNMATDNIEKWLDAKGGKNADAIEVLKGENSKEKRAIYWEKAINNIYFIEWLSNNRRYFDPEENKVGVSETNWELLKEIIGTLFDLRNYWTHVSHKEILLTKTLNDTLLELYTIAGAESKTNIPEKYKATNGLNQLEKDRKTYEVKGTTNKLTLTGNIFFCSLFLEGGQVSEFLEAMEQSNYNFDELNKRAAFRLENPKAQYPEGLGKTQKDFLYARDLYNHWKVRGHRSNILEDDSLLEKEGYFSMLEYLKRCPMEYLEVGGIEKPKDRIVVVANKNYDIREKNKFMEWGLQFWDEEMERLKFGNKWKWARCQIADKVKQAREELEQKAETDGRPYHLPRYKKITFDLPEQIEERLNYRNDEHGFNYYFLKDDADNASQAIFRVFQGNETGMAAIGLMGSRMLCSVLEFYLAEFPIDDPTLDEQREKFWVKFFSACYQHVEGCNRGTTPKGDITPEKIARRIEKLEKEYNDFTKKVTIETIKGEEKEVDKHTTHDRIRFILDTWNQIITCGQKNNLEHASDKGSRLGGKNGYQELLRWLSLMENALDRNRDNAHSELIRTLKRLGTGKSEKTYLSVLCQTLNIKLEEYDTIGGLFDICLLYRKGKLKSLKAQLQGKEFNVKDWSPRYEMRWLGLKDGRTHKASQQTEPSREAATATTHIVNVDNKQYAAAGLPRDIRQLQSVAFRKRIDSEHIEKVHQRIYPSPKGFRLIIPEFYCMPNGEDITAVRGNQSVRRRLFLVRRQDTILAHIAFRRGKAFMEKQGMQIPVTELKDHNHQIVEMRLPVVENNSTLVNVLFYYRHYKQNRYQMPASLTKQIAQLLVSSELVEAATTLPFNSLKALPKSVMTYDERNAMLSKEDKKRPFDERKILMDEYFERMSDTVFRSRPEANVYYFQELLQGYNLCRKAFIGRIQALETKVVSKYNLQPSPNKGYIAFADIADSLLQHGCISKAEQQILVENRNAAFHGKLPPLECMPHKLQIRKPIKENPSKYYLDYFGKGMELGKEILDKLTN